MAKKSRKRLLIVIIVVMVAFIATMLWLLSNRTEAPVLVSVEAVATRTITQSVSAIGKLQPEVMVKMSSEASGEIVYLGVRDGDTVKTGQILVRIRPDMMQSMLVQTRAAAEASRMAITVAKAEYDRSEADLKRATELYKKQFASREDFDRASAAFQSAAGRLAQTQADYERAKGALRETQVNVDRTTITAPMSGVVTYLGVENGEKVVGTAQMQGTEILRIADLSTMNAWVQVDENDVAQINVGDTARIKVDALPDVELRGLVYEISHSPIVSGQGTQEEVVNFQVRIRIIDPEHRMRPGMSCSVDIETETKSNVLAVPIQSVTMQQEAAASTPDTEDYRKTDRKAAAVKSKRPQSIVWVVNNGQVAARPVTTGISDQGYLEVMNGLKVGDKVVSSPYEAISKLLTPGAKVTVEDPAARRERYRALRQAQ
ncbi:MAG: efflux RND transporter periplasmic adaptor subunit [Candidatus Kapabacteria bacterium]|nr:efflux RND transporter periplasmic adaptor subunit [Candidatus Kapabacteria bacterium]